MWRNPDVLLLSKQFQFVKNHYHCSTDFHSYSAHYFPNQKLGNNEKIIWILNSSSHSPCIQWHLEKTKVKVKEKSLSHVWLFATPWTVAYQAPLSMGFSRQEHWSGLTSPSPEDLPDPRIESRYPALQADALVSEPPGKITYNWYCFAINAWWNSLLTPFGP